MSLPDGGFVRIDSIVKPRGILPLSRSTWYAGIKQGRFPKPNHIGRIAVWRVEDLEDLLERIARGELHD